MSKHSHIYDAVVIGAGPAGSTAALTMAREGLSVLVADRARFPHFHIGESFLPRNKALIRELGLEGPLAAIPQVPKHGAEFGMGDGSPTTSIYFTQSLVPGETEAWNIERAPFDAMLLAEARRAGAEVLEGVAVRDIPRLGDGGVAVVLDNGREGREVRARWLVDASGQATVVGKHLRTRRVLPHLKKVAYFGHFENVARKPGIEGGFIVIIMCDEGWFWVIPLDERRTSIGLVMHEHVARTVGVPASRMLAWGISRCPALRERTADAVFPESNWVAADFSYRCEPYAGPGYFLAGDAATFVDPIFSTGACLGMMSGHEAGKAVAGLVRRGADPARTRRAYVRFVKGSSEPFFNIVRLYYEHSFRELFMTGQGPFQMHRAVIALLAGHVFPRPAFALAWRMRLFELCIKLQRLIPLATRRPGFSLLAGGDEARPSDAAGEAAEPAHGF